MSAPGFDVLADSSDRTAWLAKRRHTIGASESACVLGCSAWGSALELWAEKTGRVERQDLSESEVVFWGNALEESIIRGFAVRTGRPTVPFGLMLRSRRWPWLTATPDALTSESASNQEWADMRDCIRSAKSALVTCDSELMGVCANSIAEAIDGGRWWPLQTKNIGFGSAEHWAEGVPLYYRVQCAHEALVCGARKVTGAALVAGQKLVWDDIDVSTEGPLERQIVNLTQRFVREHLDTDVEPPADASESARNALSKLYPLAQPGKRVVLGAALMDVAYELDAAKARAKAADDVVRELENMVRQAIGDAEAAVFPDGSGYTLKTQTRKGYVVAPSTCRPLLRKKAREEG